MIPPRVVSGVPVVDVSAVLARHPQVCLIDGLAYDNPRGSRHAKRYQDVEELLEAGISVLTSVNLAYIADQQEFVYHVLGTTKSETVPQDFIDRADEVVVVDAPPGAEAVIEAQRLSQLRQRATSDGRCGRSSARGLSPAARHAVDMGDSGTHLGVHDAASQRRQNVSERTPEC